MFPRRVWCYQRVAISKLFWYEIHHVYHNDDYLARKSQKTYHSKPTITASEHWSEPQIKRNSDTTEGWRKCWEKKFLLIDMTLTTHIILLIIETFALCMNWIRCSLLLPWFQFNDEGKPEIVIVMLQLWSVGGVLNCPDMFRSGRIRSPICMNLYQPEMFFIWCSWYQEFPEQKT